MKTRVRSSALTFAVLTAAAALTGCGGVEPRPDPPADAEPSAPAVEPDTDITIGPGSSPVVLPTDPTTVNRSSPNDVAAATVAIQYRVDTARDTGWADAARRSTPLLAPGYAAEITHAPTPSPDADWQEWTRHDVRTDVRVQPNSEPHPPDSDHTAARAWNVATIPVGRDGWRGKPQHRTVFVTMTSTNGAWEVTGVTAR